MAEPSYKKQAPRKPDANFRLLFNPDEPIVISPSGDIPCGCIDLTACLTDDELAALMVVVGSWLQAVDEITPIVDRNTLEVLWVKLFH